MDFTGVFTYNADYLIIGTQNIILSLSIIVIFVIVLIALRMLFLGAAGWLLLRQDRKQHENRKKILSDLVLMKDIQTELEKEIEQATLKAAFQN